MTEADIEKNRFYTIQWKRRLMNLFKTKWMMILNG